MSRNQSLRVVVRNGDYDLATPFFASEYTMDHLGLAPTLRSHVSLAYDEAGHMMHLDKASHAKLHKDVVEFILSAIPR